MKNDIHSYDVIVVGAGHAGCEAAAAAANMGMQTLLITMNMNTIAQMSCNPAMGGIAKGQIVREIDALGGYSGIITDKTAVQFRMLNRSKGAAMWSPRAQSDRMRFAEEWRLQLEQLPNLYFWQESITGLVIDGRQVVGVRSGQDKIFYGHTVILTNGTFLNGMMHVGSTQSSGGRAGEKAAVGLTEQLLSAGFETGRMKTGTPPRIDGRTIDYSQTEIQLGDEQPAKFSYSDQTQALTQQLPCYITYTNAKVHALIEGGLDESPMYSGAITGTGPRYCPSIEDKVVRFADKSQHQLFIEPEGWRTCEIYLNGFSSSLPERIQAEALRHIPGLQNARMFRCGYAVEYDYFPPHQLKLSLETQLIDNLFFAGQINGTTGYEEAAAQGIMAGINAARKVKGETPIVLGRDQAYIGVLIDDLVHKSTDEPYRMFTSRAEYRILLRQDNADFRLTALAHGIGLASDERYNRFQTKAQGVEAIRKSLQQSAFAPAAINDYLSSIESSPIEQKLKAEQLLVRPNVTLDSLAEHHPGIRETIAQYDAETVEQAEIQIKYAGYIQREYDLAQKMRRLEDVVLPHNFNYTKIQSLSNEARDKLAKIKPQNLGQAARISGVNPSDISILMVFLGR
jgi:tRNA uridine 5-carboxymethylaminomethyl modification enzyme